MNSRKGNWFNLAFAFFAYLLALGVLISTILTIYEWFNLGVSQ